MKKICSQVPNGSVSGPTKCCVSIGVQGVRVFQNLVRVWQLDSPEELQTCYELKGQWGAITTHSQSVWLITAISLFPFGHQLSGQAHNQQENG